MKTRPVKALMGALISAWIFGALLAGIQAEGKSEPVRSQHFAVVMDGPITIDGEGLHADLYSIASMARIGRTVRSGSCISSDPPSPFAPPCANPPALLQGQFYYEDQVVFELSGGTIRGSLKGYEAFNANPPVNGGDRCAAAVEEGVVTGGTGKYAGAEGEFSSRISDEFKFVEQFGQEAPMWFNHSVVLFHLRFSGSAYPA